MSLRKLFSLILAGLVITLVGVTAVLVVRSARTMPAHKSTVASSGPPLQTATAPKEQPLQTETAETDVALLNCEKPGWAPSTFGLKDHSVFWHQGYYYLVSIRVPDESQFAYGRSADLCHWETLPTVLPQRKPGSQDETAIWAPYVYQEDGTFYMYYSGVNRQLSQTILLATSNNPADSSSWTTQPMVFHPDHSGTAWKPDAWADCRDPMVVKSREGYFLFYAGRDQGGGIIGLATAETPTGPWIDRGPVFPPVPDVILESPSLVEFGGASYLFYNRAGVGEFYRTASGKTSSWSAPRPLAPGWAHEIWQTTEGVWLTSYLTDSSVTISPLTWDTISQPARVLVGSTIYRGFLPLLAR